MSYLAEPGAAGSRHAANMWGIRQAAGRQANVGQKEGIRQAVGRQQPGRQHVGQQAGRWQALGRQTTCWAAGRRQAGSKWAYWQEISQGKTSG